MNSDHDMSCSCSWWSWKFDQSFVAIVARVVVVASKVILGPSKIHARVVVVASKEVRYISCIGSGALKRCKWNESIGNLAT